MIKASDGDLYYCIECDDFHNINNFIKKDYGFCCPITEEEIKYWKLDKTSDAWQVAKILGYEE